MTVYFDYILIKKQGKPMKGKGNYRSRFCQKKLNIPTTRYPTSSRITSC